MTRMTEMTSVKKARKPSARHRMSSSGRAEGHASITKSLTSSSRRAVPERLDGLRGRAREPDEHRRSRASLCGPSADRLNIGRRAQWADGPQQQASKMSISASGG